MHLHRGSRDAWSGAGIGGRPPDVSSSALLQPDVERLGVQPSRLALGQDAEERVDPRFHGPFAQQIRAEAMDGADVRLFQVHQRPFQKRARARIQVRVVQPPLEFLSQTKLQLAGGLFGERHCDEIADTGLTGGQHADDATHQLGGLAGSSSGFDDEGGVQVAGNGIAGGLIVEHRHGRLLNAMRSCSGSPDLRLIRSSSCGPQTGR